MSLILNGTTGISDVDGTAAAPALTGTDSNTGIFFPAADTIAFAEGGAEAMRIDSSGNVGIGTASPVNKLQVAGAVAATGGAGGYAANMALLDVSGGNAQITAIGANTSTVGTLVFQAFSSNASLGGERARIDSSGNVGIGTSSPSAKLHVQGNARSANSGNTVYTELQNDGVYSTGTDMYLFAPSGKFLSMYTGGAERARIDSSGNLLVGTTNNNIGGTTTVGINAASTGVLRAGCDGGAALLLNRISSDGTTAFFQRQGSTVGTISVTTTLTSYNTTSDYRLKEAIVPMTGALAKVAALKPCTYKWKVDGSDGQGFIAHELAEVEAGCVTGEKDAVDADGNPQYQGIDTSFLVATLTAAIQEQQALITALTTRITALEGAA